MSKLTDYVKENQLDTCPECGNLKGNTINEDEENPEDSSIVCAECGLSWLIDMPE